MVKDNINKISRVVAGTILFMTVLFWVGCGKNTNVRWMHYDETQCADKWARTNNNEVLKDNITRYFKDKGIRIYEVEIFTDGPPEACTSCTCKSGRRIKVKVKRSETDDMKAEGFYE